MPATSGRLSPACLNRTPDDRENRTSGEAITRDIQPQLRRGDHDESTRKLAEPMRIVASREYGRPAGRDRPITIWSGCSFSTAAWSRTSPRTGLQVRRWARYYTKPQDNLCLMEWQHSNANSPGSYASASTDRRDRASRKRWLGHRERLEYLAGMEMAIRGIERRAYNCACECRRQAAACGDPVRKARLLQMAANCMQVPMNPARTFEEAVQCLYFSFDFLADSIAALTSTVAFYQADLANGTLTRPRPRAAAGTLGAHPGCAPPSGNHDKGGEPLRGRRLHHRPRVRLERPLADRRVHDGVDLTARRSRCAGT